MGGARRQDQRALAGERLEEGGVIDEAADEVAGLRQGEVVEEGGERFRRAVAGLFGVALALDGAQRLHGGAMTSRQSHEIEVALAPTVDGEAVERGEEAVQQRRREIPVIGRQPLLRAGGMPVENAAPLLKR